MTVPKQKWCQTACSIAQSVTDHQVCDTESQIDHQDSNRLHGTRGGKITGGDPSPLVEADGGEGYC